MSIHTCTIFYKILFPSFPVTSCAFWFFVHLRWNVFIIVTLYSSNFSRNLNYLTLFTLLFSFQRHHERHKHNADCFISTKIYRTEPIFEKTESSAVDSAFRKIAQFYIFSLVLFTIGNWDFNSIIKAKFAKRV